MKGTIETDIGKTHYALLGSGPLIVLSHGLLSDMHAFDPIVGGLVRNGFTCLTYDLYDRGKSVTTSPLVAGRHVVSFGIELHVKQLRDLLVALHLTGSFVHVGHSLGGGVGVGYAVAYPQSVRGLCLIDAVVLPTRQPVLTKLTRVPLLGDILVQIFGRQAFLSFFKKSHRDPSHPIIFKEAMRLRERLGEPRFFASCVASTRAFPGLVGSHYSAFLHVAKSLPIHLVWGDKDETCVIADCMRLHESAKDSSVHILKDAPHDSFAVDMTNAQEVMSSICKFATRASSKKAFETCAPGQQ